MLTDSLALSAEDFAGILSSGEASPAPAGPAPSEDGKSQAEDVRPLAESIAELERRSIKTALEKTHGNKALTARMLGISRATLYQKIIDYKIVSD
jgi:DNA-binding NtrC family response regulator